MKLFSIKDIKIESWGPVFEARNINEVNRSLTKLVNDTKDQSNQLKDNPQDFEVYELGEMNVDTGVITARTSPLQHFNLAHLRISKNS